MSVFDIIETIIFRVNEILSGLVLQLQAVLLEILQRLG